MKNLMVLFAIVLTTACSSVQDPDDIDPTLEVQQETTEKIKQAQDVNIELEEIDGELDSLIIKIN